MTKSHEPLAQEPTAMTDGNAADPCADDSLPDTLPETLPQDNTAYIQEEHLRDAKEWATASAPQKDVSQQEPTQPNEGRSYDEACTRVFSSMPNMETQQSNIEARTLHEDDTGAVNFGSLTQYPRQSSPVSEDVGFENVRGGWRISDDTQQNSLYSHTPHKNGEAAPETPAVPKNPFGAAAGGPAPFAGTQLFGQTQMLTSAVKNSPTSSRPSPNIFHNPVSPSMMETSPLKNRANVSSPTEVRTSSPQRLHEVPATVMKGPKMAVIEEETPSLRRSANDETIPESPTYDRPRSSERQPMAHYEPIKQSQARKALDDVQPIMLDEDSEPDDAVQRLERRRRIERMRAQAAKEMVKITFPETSHNETNDLPVAKRRRFVDVDDNGQGEFPKGESRWKNAAAQTNRSSQQAVAKSHLQSLDPPSLESTKATPGDEAEEDDQNPKQTTHDGENTVADAADDEMIPATSPVEPASDNDEVTSPVSEPDLPTLPTRTGNENAPTDVAESSSLPQLRGRPVQKYGRRARSLRRTVATSSSASVSTPDVRPTASADGFAPHATAPELGAERSGSVALIQTTPITMRTRAKKGLRTPVPFVEQGVPTTGSSTLSPLSTAPCPSSKTTPTKDSSVHRQSETEVPQSPSTYRNLRKRTLAKEHVSASPQSVARSLRMSKRLHTEPQSSDPIQSPQVKTPEEKSTKSTRQSIEPVYRNERCLFQGMAFAISVQSEQTKQQSRVKLETRITNAGGFVLQDGFQELFQPSPIITTAEATVDAESELVLSQRGGDCGFTALIADGHSRKAKYMQALALGLPCLATEWVKACLNKGAIIDWQPYLLCAGASAVLGNAIRSRCLVPYRADEAKLRDVIDERNRLLYGQSILIVVDPKKTKSQAKQPYIFLTQTLGPSITRVSTVEQARELVHSRGKGSKSFDWLYIDGTTGTADAVLSPPARGSKKRKKTPPSPVHNIRILHDELIIQSLILSRLVEVDEENF